MRNMGLIAQGWHEFQYGGKSLRLRSQHHVFQGATETDIHFAQKGIDHADLPFGVRKQIDPRIGDPEYPGLRIVRIGGKDARGNNPLCGGRPVAPVPPGFISDAFSDTEDTLVGRAQNDTTCHGDERRSAEFQEVSTGKFHDIFST
jgi:hypothetical protein